MNKIDIDNKEITIKNDKEIYIFDKENNERIYNVEKNAYLRIYHYNLDCNSNIKVNLNGENANIEYHYSMINYNDNKLSFIVNHNSKNTTSNIYNHGVNVLNNKLHFDIKTKVGKNMSNCICNQENQIINLDDGNSTVLPILLIDNYDIISTHSAYIGKFKDDIIFYLMSRGIKYDSAIKLLINSLLLNDGENNEKLISFKKEIENI